MMLYLLVPKVEEYNIGTVRGVERIKKVRGVERIERVRKVGQAIRKIR